MLNQILNFIEGQYIYCPRCLKRIPFRSDASQDIACPVCNYVIPSAYMRQYKNAPPVFVQLFGLPAAGKTTFLDMLRLHLLDMDQVWDGYYPQPITQLDMDHQAILILERSQGVIPGSTPKRDRDQNEVYIQSLMHMARWDSHFLVLMDHSGESFGPLVIDVKEIPFLQHTPVTILLLSLPDLARDGKRVNDLVTSYITSLEANGVNFAKERRQLIIVFSKADLIPNLPKELTDYLNTDTIYMSLKKRSQNVQMDEVAMDNYIQKMEVISNCIRAWVAKSIPGGATMLRMLHDKGIVSRFTVMSATGHTLSNSGNTLAPAPRRVLDPFFWVMEFYKHIGAQEVVQANVATIIATFSPALRKVRSLILVMVLFFCTLLGGIYSFNLSHGSASFAGFCVSLFFLLVCTLVNENAGERSPVIRSILTITRLALVIAALALQTLPSVQHMFYNLTLYQLSGGIILIAALFSLFMSSDLLALQHRVTLAAIAGICALFQSTFGEQYVLRLIPFISPSEYTATNSILVCILVAGAVLSLLLSTKKLIWVDRALLFVIAPIYGGLQYAFGYKAITHAFPSAPDALLSPTHIASFNTVLVFILVIAIPLALFFLHRFPRLDRLPLLILAGVCASLLNFLGSGVRLPIVPASSHLLVIKVVELFIPTRFVEYMLVAVSICVCIRFLLTCFPGKFTFIDYVALFIVAFVCEQLQGFSWGSSALQESNGALSALNQIVARSLTVLIFLGLGVTFVLLLLPLARQFKEAERIIKGLSAQFAWINHLRLWINRIMACGTAVGCALLAALYGQKGPIPSYTFSMGGVPVTLYQIIAVFFVLLALIALRRLKQPFTRGDRFLLLINIIFCTAFFFERNVPLIPLSFVLQRWNDNTFLSINLLFAAMIVIIALIALWWSGRCLFFGDRRVLQIIFGFALAGGLLQLIAPSLFSTLLALVALIMGIVVATMPTSSTL